MNMYVMYQGKAEEDGRFVLTEEANIPKGTRVLIAVFDRQLADSHMQSAERIARKEKALSAISGVIPSDFDLDAMRYERITRKGL